MNTLRNQITYITHKREIRKGEIYWANLDGAMGSEQGRFRPVVIISNEKCNTFGPTVLVAPVTTQSKTYIPTHINIGTETGVESPSTILIEQLRTIDKIRLGDYIGQITEEQEEKIMYAYLVQGGYNEIFLKMRNKLRSLMKILNHKQKDNNEYAYAS